MFRKLSSLILLSMLFLSAYTPRFQNGNDIVLNPSISYGRMWFPNTCTEADPCVVYGNDAWLECAEVTGQWYEFYDVNVRNCVTHGFYINGGSFIKVFNGEVTNTARETNTSPTTCSSTPPWGSALKVKVGSHDILFDGMVVHENCGEGVAVTRGYNVVVQNSTFYNNFAANLYADNSYNVTFFNNISYCTPNNTYLRDGGQPHGIAIGEESYAGWGAQLHNISIIKNTMTGCKTGLQGIASEVGGTYTNISFDNNTINSATKRSISLDESKNLNVTITNNKVYAFDYWVRSTAGVTFSNNTLIGTSTNTPLPFTLTPTITMTPTKTNTPLIPTVTSTRTNTPQVPTTTMTPSSTPTTASRTPTPSRTPTVSSPTPSQTPTVTPSQTATPQINTPTPEPDGCFVDTKVKICYWVLP